MEQTCGHDVPGSRHGKHYQLINPQVYHRSDEEITGFGRFVVLKCWLPEEFDQLKAAPIAVVKAFLYICKSKTFFGILANKIHQLIHQ